MKKLIGFLAAVLTLAFITILVFRIWGVEIISIENLIKSNLTLITLGVAVVILIVIYGFFFKNSQENYDKTIGNRAHPKNQS